MDVVSHQTQHTEGCRPVPVARRTLGSVNKVAQFPAHQRDRLKRQCRLLRCLASALCSCLILGSCACMPNPARCCDSMRSKLVTCWEFEYHGMKQKSQADTVTFRWQLPVISSLFRCPIRRRRERRSCISDAICPGTVGCTGKMHTISDDSEYETKSLNSSAETDMSFVRFKFNS